MPSISDDATSGPPEARASLSRSSSYRFLVHDEQQRIGRKGAASFVHIAYVVDKPSDVQYGSELEAHYYPQFEQLTLHFARIHREDKTIDALQSADVRRLHLESDRENFMYDEGEDIVAVLKDVRRGDAIEWAYSIDGQNPAVLGRVLSMPRLAFAASVKSSLFRLLTPTDARVNYRLHGLNRSPSIVKTGPFTEYRWEQSGVLAVEDEGDTPEWFVAEPWVEFTDFSNWAEVSAWALPLYAEPKTLPTELEKYVIKWQQIGSDTQKLSTVLRFVQDELRYLGMEIGPHSLVPHPPAQTFEQRFGDCKDKTLLLVTILHRLGIAAVPALVASREGRLLSERLPSPYAFDHVIAKVTLGNEVYWLDPTVSSARSDLKSHRYSDFHFALPIAADTQALEPLTAAPLTKPLSEVEEEYELGHLDGQASLTVSTRLRGPRADEFRSRYEQRSFFDFKRDYINFFAKRFEVIEYLSDPTVFDDEASNEVAIVERYRIHHPFDCGELRLSPWSFDDLLALPEVVRRTSPLGVEFPYLGEHRIVLLFSVAPEFELPNFEEHDAVLRFSAHGIAPKGGRRATVSFTLETATDSIPIAQVPTHLALRRRLNARSGVRLLQPGRIAKPGTVANSVSTKPRYMVLGATLTPLLLAGYYGVRVLRRRKRNLEASIAGSTSIDQVDDSSLAS